MEQNASSTVTYYTPIGITVKTALCSHTLDTQGGEKVKGESFTVGSAEGEGGSRCGGKKKLCLVRFHVRTQQRIDARLVAASVRLEPVQHLTIQPDGYGRFRLWEPKHGAFEEGFALLWNIGE